jgi:cyclic pyranopterin phosphate synthase
MIRDSHGRKIRDLRISVTDRCNFKCTYCKTLHGSDYADRKDLLTYEEIAKVSNAFLELGVRKIRVTGGEPLLRKNLDVLINKLAKLRHLEDLALTTNGFNLFGKADLLKKAGLKRVTISLDTLVEQKFFEITKSHDFQKVIRSIETSKKYGFEPVKVNCVVIRGFNDDEISDFAQFAREWDLEVRFIEFMPLDEDENWTRERVVTGEEILTILSSQFELSFQPPSNPSETAKKYEFQDGRGRIGLIMSVSQAFCDHCSRVRLTADGKIRNCLFSHKEYDLKTKLRAGMSIDELKRFLVETVEQKEKGHRIGEDDFIAPSRTMSYIGG